MKVSKELADLRKKYFKQERELQLKRTQVKTNENHLRALEESHDRLEREVQYNLLEVRKLDKHNSKLKSQIEELKQITHPEKLEVKDLKGLVKTSQSIFSAFESQNLTPQQEVAMLGDSGRVLMDLARITEQVVDLKNNLQQVKKAQKELEMSESFQEEVRDMVKVKFKNILDQEDSCLFPQKTFQGESITFEDLLAFACKYWDLVMEGYVLVDENYNIWPASSPVEASQSEVWVMSKEEANYYKEKTQESEEEVQDLLKHEEERLESIREQKTSNYTLEKTRLKNAVDLLIYFLFLVLFTWSAQDLSIFEFYQARDSTVQRILGHPFPKNSSSPIHFHNIVLASHLFNFLEDSFVPSFFEDSKYNGDNLTTKERKYLFGVYRKVGPIRVLQKRVEDFTCEYTLSDKLGKLNGLCSDDYSEEIESKQTLENSQELSWYKYQSYENPRVLRGKHNSYKLNGYVALFNSSQTYQEALNNLQIFRTWISEKTRLLSIDANFCNSNIDLCMSWNIYFEWMSGGSITPGYQIHIFRVKPFWTVADYAKLLGSFLALGISFYFLVQIILKFKRQGCKSTFNFWNCLLVLLFLLVLFKNIAIFLFLEQEMIKNFDPYSEEFVDYMQAAYYYSLINNFKGFCLFIAYFSVLGFLKDSRSLRIIWGTLRNGMYQMTFFFLVFILLFVGWSLVAFRGFGQYLGNFKDMGSTSSTLGRILLGETDFDSMYKVNPVFSGMFFISFLFMNYFVMINVFLAIINESYDTVYKKVQSGSSEKDEMLLMIELILKGLKHVLIDLPVNLVKCKGCRKKQETINSN